MYKQKIIIIDNSGNAKEIFKDFINILFVNNEEEAHNAIEKEYKNISAIIENINIAKLNDFELINYYKENLQFMQLAFIGLSLDADIDDSYFKLGFSDIIAPPFLTNLLRKRIGNAIKAQSSLTYTEIKNIFSELPSNIYIKDVNSRYIFASHYWEHIEEQGPNWDIRGKTDLEIRKDKKNALKAIETDKKVIEEGVSLRYVIEEKSNGKKEYLELIKSPIVDENGKVKGIAGLINDITEIQNLKNELEKRSQTDELTGLLNKSATENLIKAALNGNDNSLNAFLIMDCDNFKQINDNYGHLTGDRVLMLVGNAIKRHSRSSDIAGRIGGDEFVLFLKNINSTNDIYKIIKNINKKIKESFEHEEIGDKVSLSIGAIVFNNINIKFNELYQKTDKLLYKVKNNGKNGYKVELLQKK